MSRKRNLFFFITLWFVVSFNSQWSSVSLPGVGVGLILVLEALLLFLNLSSLFTRLNIYKKWVILLLFFWGLSTIWSVNPNAFGSYWKYSIQYVIAFAVSSAIVNKIDVEKFLKIYIFAAFLCGLYVVLFVNAGDLTEVRLGSETDVMKSVWNSNDIGIKMSMGYAFSIYFLMKGGVDKFLLYTLIGFFFILSFLSGSRSVVLLLIAFTAMLMIVRSKGGKMGLYFMIAVFFVIVAYWMIMNIPVFYDIVGQRFDKMIDGLSGGEGGFSMDIRSLMIAYGLEWFMEQPLVGQGFDGFSILFGRVYGIVVYSHSNIIEMLANTGIIGFCLYYSLTVYILAKLWRPALHEKEPLALVLFVYTFIAALSDYVVVSYVNTPYVFRLMFTAMYCHILNRNNPRKIITIRK